MKDTIVEEGEAFRRLNGLEPEGRGAATERVPVVVIGAGQSGLSVGYHLSRQGVPFVILDSNARVGDTWRKRWDSLRLFTSARYDGLDGMPFPGDPLYFPTKDEMADYLESYAKHFGLRVENGVSVDRITLENGRYVVRAGKRRFEAEHVVVAMATYQRGKMPPFAKELDPAIVQIHSSDYRNLSQLREGGVLIVGAGNSGAEIALETAKAHPTWMSGRNVGEVPFRINGFFARLFLARFVLRFVFHRVLTLDTPMGRKARPSMISKGAPLIRARSVELAAAGVRRVPKLAGVRGGKPVLEDGQVLDVANVVWCTGFHPGLSWVERPVFGEDGEPIQERGVAAGEPGLYFVGLHFLYAFSSTMIHGVGRDAEHVAGVIAARRGAVRAA
jgi:putative flavoprotein involved in K+ transport